MTESSALQIPGNAKDPKIRVMLVDDSAVVRGLLSRWLGQEDNMEVVARCHNGAHALRNVKKAYPTIIILDIEMPEMDGLEALPLLLEAVPDARILIASGLSNKNAKISMRALSKGAHDFLAKPTTNSSLTTSNEFRIDLVTKINALCVGSGGKPAHMLERAQPSNRIVSPYGKSTIAEPSKFARSVDLSPVQRTEPLQRDRNKSSRAATPDVLSSGLDTAFDTSIKQAGLRPFKRAVPGILCIGSSTGGPRAVQSLLTQIASHIDDVPVVLTQHMPKSFTTVFADHLAKILPVPVNEAKHGTRLESGKVYLAPGDYHLTFGRCAGGFEIVLDDGPEMNFCKPAVDKMFMSAAELFGAKTLGIVLTGMGQDGVVGGKMICDAGGNVIAQDAASSIVWGMPGAAYRAGVCSGVFALNEMGDKIRKIMKEGCL